MDTEDLLPRLALFVGVVAAVVVYTRRRGNRMKKVEGSVADMPQAAVGAASDAAGTLAERGQSLFESVLDNIAEQALKELKVVLKDGLKRLEKTVDAL